MACDLFIKLMMIGDSGIDYKTKMLWMRGKRVKLQVWDTAGQERFQTITQQYYRSAMGILMVYDVTSEASFQNISRWNEQISKHADKDVQRVLVGNKADAEDIAVAVGRGQELAEKYGIPFFETSAWFGENVNQAFIKLAEMVIQQRRREERRTTMRYRRDATVWKCIGVPPASHPFFIAIYCRSIQFVN
ncbi:unnamed protein product [Durusdinium trenchii]|uniref:Uncharacterized protein n=1 Tax=Durusdinium trenchii TaxID=1381693 RepID=A0ABP0QXW6_9DINO